MYVDEEHLESFMTEAPITETSPLICITNQWACFCTKKNLRHERVNALLLAVFIEIYSLIITK